MAPLQLRDRVVDHVGLPLGAHSRAHGRLTATGTDHGRDGVVHRQEFEQAGAPAVAGAGTTHATTRLVRRSVSQFRPPPLAHACTQAVWLGADGPALVRNYDFPLAVVSPQIESTRWFGREVISKGQRPWGGCLDGMNADGLVASLTFGGSAAQGEGFAIILIVRYVLETCRTAAEAVAALCRIPVAQSQNVTVLDKAGRHATVYMGPGRTPAVTQARVCANHQDADPGPLPSAHAAGSIARQQAAQNQLGRPGASLADLVNAFQSAPIHSRQASSPTVYGAVYRPEALTVDYVWPGHVMRQGIGAFKPGAYVHDYGELLA